MVFDTDDEAGRALLDRTARGLFGMVRSSPLGPDVTGALDRGWVPLEEACGSDALVRSVTLACERWGTEDRVVGGSLLVREWTVAVTSLAVELWVDGRALDLSIGNLAVRSGVSGSTIALVDASLAGGPVSAQRDSLVEALLDDVVPLVIGAFVHVERVGPLHLWGNVALTIANDFATAGHRIGSVAEVGRDRFLQHRPELSPTIEVITVPDGLEPSRGDLTFAIRQTCCLLDKLAVGRDPSDLRCGTCSLNDRTARVVAIANHFRAERAAATSRPTTAERRTPR